MICLQSCLYTAGYQSTPLITNIQSSLKHTPRHTVLWREWTHLGCTLWCVHNGLSGQDKAENKPNNNVRISLPRTADKLQYSCPANPLICKRKSQKIGYSLKEHLAAPQTIVIVSLWPYMRKLVNVFWHISPHKTTKSQVWLCHVTVCV